MLTAILPLSASAYGHSATNPLPAGAYKSWKQTDERWRDVVIGIDPWTDGFGVRHEEETMGHAGCLITSMAILTRAYGLTLADRTEINPRTLGLAMYDDGSCKYLNKRGGALYQTAFNTLIPGVRFVQLEQPGNPVSRIERLLSDPEKEYIIIAGVNDGGHYVAVDYVENGKVHICDPGYDRSLLSEYSVYCLLVYEVEGQYVDPGATVPSTAVWKVIESAGVRIRTGPARSYAQVGTYKKGTQFELLETVEADEHLWGRTADGWCALRMLNGAEIYCEPVEGAGPYPVTYHTNGGTGAPETQYKTAGIDLRLSSMVPTKKGYRFLGWSPDPSAVSAAYIAGDVYRGDASLALYAVWMAESDIFGFGIDVSSWQGVVDWKAVAADGISFVILRAGTTYGKDTMFEENYLGAKAAGLHIGSYFYSYALTDAEAEQDARAFLEYLGDKTFDMPVYLDLETEEQLQLSSERLVQLALHFQNVLDGTGLLCGVYSSASWFETKLDNARLGGRECLWVAKWTSSGTLSQNMSEQFGLYQYSDAGRVAGIETDVDLDVCYIDYPALLSEPWTGGEKDSLPMPASGLKIQEGVVYGARPGMTALEWAGLFDGLVTFRTAAGELMEAEDIVTTGCVVDCGSRSYPIGVRGDLTGDGSTDARDYILLKRHVLGTYRLEGAAYYAGCLSGNSVNAMDYVFLKRYVLGTYNLYSDSNG